MFGKKRLWKRWNVIVGLSMTSLPVFPQKVPTQCTWLQQSVTECHLSRIGRSKMTCIQRRIKLTVKHMIICNKNSLWRALKESNIAEWFLAGEWLRRVIKKIPPYISSSYIDKVLFPPGTRLSSCVVSSFTNFIWTNFLQQPLKVNMKWSKHTLFYMDVRTHTSSVCNIYKWWDRYSTPL